MKTNIKKIFLTCGITLSIGINAQTNYKGWFDRTRLIDFTGASPVLKPTYTGAAAFANSPSNSMYDSEGKLLFYINGTTIYNKFNVSIGVLANPWPNSTSYVEFAIVPNPDNNQCTNKFYIIYPNNIAQPLNGRMGYGVVDMNALNGQGSFTMINNNMTGTAGAPTQPIAVSKANINGKRYLYYAGGALGDLQIHEITNTGINYLTQTTLSPGVLMGNFEMELSNAGDKLLFSQHVSGNTKISILPLNPTTGLYTGGTILNFNETGQGITGLEFNNAGDKIFYAKSGSGIYYKDLAPFTSTPGTLISGTSNFGNSMLEKSFNGSEIICASSSLSQIKSINPVTNVLNGWTISSYVLPTITFGGNNISLMPDQIDGENYDATGSINIDVANYTESTGGTWIPTSNPILTQLQNIIMGNLTTLPRIRFGGDLTVAPSVVLTISGMEFQHQTNTAIKMNGGSNVTITGSFLHAHTCGKMWKGIDVNNNNTGSATTLLMQKAGGKAGANTRLADALKGVYADEPNSLVRIITRCQLYDNEKSVVIINGNPNNEFYNSFYQQINPLRDQAYGNNNGYSSNYGITGIELQNTSISNAQNIGWATQAGNTFDGGQYGIDAQSSSLNSYLNTIQNIKSKGINSNANWGNSKINVQQTTFNSNYYDIDCYFGNDLTVQRSNFNNCAGNSISWNYNWNHKLYVGADLTYPTAPGTIADANIFTGCGWNAVRCLDNEGNETIIQINYNTIQNAPASGGVNISETNLTNNILGTFDQFRISNNTINNIADCITLQNVRGDILGNQSTAYYNGLDPTSQNPTANVELNTVNFSTGNNPGISAIKNYNSPQTKIYENTVTSDNSADWQNIGVDVSDSPNSFVYKNIISAGRGLEARLNMTNGNYMCNDFNSCVIGIQLAWEWLRNSDEQHGISGIYSRRNNFNTPLGAFDMECYYSSPSLNQWCNPYTSAIAYTGVTGNIVYDAFSPNPVCYPCQTCRQIHSNNTANIQEGESLINGKLGSTGASKYNQYKAWVNTFEKLNKNKNTIISALAANDKQRLVNLVTVNEHLSAKNYTAAANLLQTTTGGNVYETNLASVYGIIAAKKSQNYRVATVAEKTALIAIAQQHPIEAGPSVYNARAILKGDFNLDFGWEDSTAVGNVTANNRKLTAIENNGDVALLNIYPNPSNGKFTLHAEHNNQYLFNVTNVLGIEVVKGEFNSKTEVNLSHLPQGVYIVNFNNTVTGEITKKSLILSK